MQRSNRHSYAWLFILTCIISFCSISAQNIPPQISDIKTEPDISFNLIKIRYTLTDPDNSSISISLKLSNDSGKTFLCPYDSLKGDAGYPVSPGSREIILYYNPKTLNPSGTAAELKVMLTADDQYKIPQKEISDKVDSNKIKEYLSYIAGSPRHRSAPANLESVKKYIQDKFSQFSLITGKDNFTYNSYQAANITGTLPGLKEEAKVYILCGHYDSVKESPGADDNGSAVAGMLEAARVLSEYRFSKSIKFIGFDLEEDGLIGSQNYAKAAKARKDNIEGVIDYEMIGYYSDKTGSQSFPFGFQLLFPDVYKKSSDDGFRGNFIAGVVNTASQVLKTQFDNSASACVPELKVNSFALSGLGESLPSFRRSDHASFWDEGYKAMMLTDCADYRNPNYHKASDVISTLNIKFLSNVVKATVATLASLAEPLHAVTAMSSTFRLPVTGIKEANYSITFELKQNYPNPFNPSTVINYTIPSGSHVSLRIYDLLGHGIAVLQDGYKPAGSFNAVFNGSGFPSGLYLYVLHAGEHCSCKKLLLLK